MSDTKELQKEINNLTGKLDRTFAVTDELVFKVRRSVLCLTVAVAINTDGRWRVGSHWDHHAKDLCS